MSHWKLQVLYITITKTVDLFVVLERYNNAYDGMSVNRSTRNITYQFRRLIVIIFDSCKRMCKIALLNQRTKQKVKSADKMSQNCRLFVHKTKEKQMQIQ